LVQVFFGAAVVVADVVADVAVVAVVLLIFTNM
jgi:hypothetical protein